ncbi:MAG TPA: c-type cytochrome [Phototrophicaceae bacterium]|nr:c-type cytochrome [Phototrophicaceae bacterium]
MTLQRLLINRIEQRILISTIAFLGILVVIGWLAINEGGRMAAFDSEFTARAIEDGATLFNTNCSPCHGVDGLGSARAPALNSPLLFGFDYLADIHKQQSALKTELGLPATTDARKTEINAQLADLQTQETQAEQQLQPAIAKGYDPDQFNRLANVGWGSTLYNYIYSTVTSGRPVSSSYWPQPMPNWSQIAGGPLRVDQVQDIVQFVLNWDKGSNWTVDDLLAVQQFPKVPVDPATVAQLQQQIQQLQQSGGQLPQYVGETTSIDDIMKGLQGVTGDAQRGQLLYTGQTTPVLPCSGCHTTGTGPAMQGTWTRVVNERLKDPKFAGWTGEEYIADSIIHPSDYVVPGFTDGIMPPNFGSQLTYQDLADLIAYLKTQDQPSS